MNAETIIVELQQIFRKEFSDNNIVISAETTAEDIVLWDSLTHMGLMDTVERHFNTSFSLDEIISFKNVGDLINSLTDKLP